jgi:hypothetical protein
VIVVGGFALGTLGSILLGFTLALFAGMVIGSLFSRGIPGIGFALSMAGAVFIPRWRSGNNFRRSAQHA